MNLARECYLLDRKDWVFKLESLENIATGVLTRNIDEWVLRGFITSSVPGAYIYQDHKTNTFRYLKRNVV